MVGRQTKRIADYHQAIVQAIEAEAARAGLERLPADRYTGTRKTSYALKAASYGQIIKEWLERHPDLTRSEYAALFDSLSRGSTYNEFVFVGLLLRHLPDFRRTLDP